MSIMYIPMDTGGCHRPLAFIREVSPNAHSPMWPRRPPAVGGERDPEVGVAQSRGGYRVGRKKETITSLFKN
jgi:hypothetical protein